mgnify:CR=1 FL=1
MYHIEFQIDLKNEPENLICQVMIPNVALPKEYMVYGYGYGYCCLYSDTDRKIQTNAQTQTSALPGPFLGISWAV